MDDFDFFHYACDFDPNDFDSASFLVEIADYLRTTRKYIRFYAIKNNKLVFCHEDQGKKIQYIVELKATKGRRMIDGNKHEKQKMS